MTDSLTIVVTATKSLSAESESVLAAWTVRRLLNPALWVTVAGNAAPGWTITQTQAHWTGEQNESSLFDRVGSLDVHLIRVVALSILETAGANDEWAHCSLAWKVYTQLNLGRAGLSHEVQLVHLVVPHADVTFSSFLLPRLSGAHTLIASPEQRRTPRSLAVPLVAEDVMPFAAHALSVAGGLLGGVDHLPWELSGRVAEARTVVFRSWTRVLLGGDVTERVGQLALPQKERWPVPHRGSELLPTSSQPQLLVEDISRQLLRFHEPIVDFHPAIRPVPPEFTEIGFLEAFRRMGRAILRRARQAPGDWLLGQIEVVAARLEDIAQNVTYGQESELKVVFLRGVPSGEDIDEQAIIERYVAAIVESLDRAQARAERPPAVPGLWGDLRATAFGILDGSKLPECIADPPLDGVVPVIVDDPTHVSPDPEIEPFRLEPACLRGEHEQDVLVAPWDCLRRKLMQRAMKETPKSQQDAKKEAAAGGAPDPRADSPDEVRLLRQAHDQLTQWATAQGATLTGRVGDHIATQYFTAVSALESARSQVEAGPAAMGDQHVETKEERHHRKRRRLILGVAVLVLLGLLGGVIGIAIGAAIAVVYAISVLGVGLLAWVIRFAKRLREQERAAYRRQRGIDDYEFAVKAAEKAALEANRLLVTYSWYLEWAEIISWHAHRPFAAPRHEANPGGTEEIHMTAMPAAMRVERGEASVSELHSIANAVALETFAPSWLRTSYDGVVLESMGRFQQEWGGGSGLPKPDEDRTTRSPLAEVSQLNNPILRNDGKDQTPRAWLLGEMRTGMTAVDGGREVWERIRHHLQSASPEDLFPQLENKENAERYLSEIINPPERTDLWPPLFSAEARAAGRCGVENLHMWSPLKVPSGPLSPEVDQTEALGAGGSYSAVAVRIESVVVGGEDLLIRDEPLPIVVSDIIQSNPPDPII